MKPGSEGTRRGATATGLTPAESTLYRFLVQQGRPYSRNLAAILALSLLSAPLALLTPVPLKVAIDSAVGSRPPPAFLRPFLGDTHSSILIGVVILLLVVALMSELQQLALSQMRAYTGEQIVMRLRTRLFGHLQRLSLSYHDAQGTPDSVYRLQYDAATIRYVVVDGLIPFIAAGVTLASMIIVTARIDWQLALVALAVSPFLYLSAAIYRRRMRTGARGVKKLESEALGVVQEVLTVLRVVKVFGQEQREEERFARCATSGVRARLRLVLLDGLFGLLVGAITAAGSGAVLLIGVSHVRSGAMTLGDLVLILGYLTQLYVPLKTMSKQLNQVQDSMASAERIYSLLANEPEVPEHPGTPSRSRSSGALVFDNVSFAYDGRTPALRNVSFKIEPGSRVGVEGFTGAGKTTLVSLIARFYDPSAGRILLDGVDLRDYRLEDLRRQMAFVLQEPVLFATSIAENIAYARLDATEDEIVAAAKTACAHEFITALPDGYETLVGERGMRLSGGERQRLSLARAFLKDAPILILDEPTSALDAATEAELLVLQERVMEGRTAIVVAHRPRLLEGCDLRLRVESGALVTRTQTASRARVNPSWSVVTAADETRAGQNGDRTRPVQPPDAVVETARRLLTGLTAAPELVESEVLDRCVHRLRFEVRGWSASLVVKRLSRHRARLNELVAQHWLPGSGLGWACPRVCGVVRGEQGDTKVWQIYEDVGGSGLDRVDADPDTVRLVVNLIAAVHLRFAWQPVLTECRKRGDDFGMSFFVSHVARCLHHLRNLEAVPNLSEQQAQLRSRLLDRIEDLYRERHERARLVDAVGGPDTLLHGDLWTSNTLVTGKGARSRARLIDWDHAGAGPVSYDLSTFLYRFPIEDRPWILALYRETLSRAGWHLPTDDELNLLFDTAETARYACCLGEAASAAERGEPWAFAQLAEIERWFASLEPALPV